MITYKGNQISDFEDRQTGLKGFVWDDPETGAESDEVFPTVAAAKADIDRIGYTDAPAFSDYGGSVNCHENSSDWGGE